MQVKEENISKVPRTLKDYIPLVITFFVGLIVLSIYQNTILYATGVLDTIINKSLFIHILHHLGYAAVCSVLFAFLFNLLENKKSNLGFKVVRLLLIVLLILEGILTTYFISNYEPLGAYSVFNVNMAYVKFSMLKTFAAIILTLVVCYYVYKYTSPFYRVISRMYPFTIILFSMFLATLYSDRKPINENKTQYLFKDLYDTIFESDTYEGDKEYPLVRAYAPNKDLFSYIDLTAQKPNIKILIVEGLGNDFVDTNGAFSGIMPHLQKMATESLYWSNFLSNTGEGDAALPTIIGSLPYGTSGFTNVERFIHRNTLFSILQENGYETSFNYGGNSALNSYDRFLVQEGIGKILDKTVFGKEYELQDEDAAGITLGYPDGALFKRYSEEITSHFEKPQLDVFQTLSTKSPYSIPNFRNYQAKVERFLTDTRTSEKTKRFVAHNVELFASYSYTDEAIHTFFKQEQVSEAFENTIYIITGSHLNRNIPSSNPIRRYQVPLLIYSPLVHKPKRIKKLTSHFDIAPAIVSLLDGTYGFKVPKTVAWMGTGELMNNEADFDKEIPLYRGANNIQDYVYDSYFLSDGKVNELDSYLGFVDTVISEAIVDTIKRRFRYSKSVNTYVTQNDKIWPSEIASVTDTKRAFSKTELLWLQSVFNGKDFDNAYNTARKLAFDKDWDRALLLCEYILSEIPRHADTEILKGRIYSWQQEYDKSISTLKEVVRKYPEYVDGYSALLDTYYWAKTPQSTKSLLSQINRYKLSNVVLNQKIQRATEQVLMYSNPTVKSNIQ